MRVLFITATRLGDAVLSSALLEHLRRTMPGARFTVACGPVAAPLFAPLPGLERVIVVEKQRCDLHWARLWAACATRWWDLAVDLRGSLVTLLLPARRRRIMRGGRRPGHRLGHLAAVLALPAGAIRPTVWTTVADRSRARALLGDGPVWIGLGPTANWAGKAWPADRFVALFETLRASLGDRARPVVFGGPGAAERRLAAPVLDAFPDAVDLADGRSTLPLIAASLARCALFVGNDSGLMHLAAAAGTPTLGLFGPSRVDEYAPIGRRTGTVVAPGPTGTAPIGELAVADAVAAARALLDADGFSRRDDAG